MFSCLVIFLECLEPFAREDKTPEGEKIFGKKSGYKVERGQKRFGLFILSAMANALDNND